jgi:hypothetical protein
LTPRVWPATDSPVARWWPQPWGSATVPGNRSPSSFTGTRTVEVSLETSARAPSERPQVRRIVGVQVEVVCPVSREELEIVGPRVVRADGSAADEFQAAGVVTFPREVRLELCRLSEERRWPELDFLVLGHQPLAEKVVGAVRRTKDTMRLTQQTPKGRLTADAEKERQEQFLGDPRLSARPQERGQPPEAAERPLGAPRAEERDAACTAQVEVHRRLIALLACRLEDGACCLEVRARLKPEQQRKKKGEVGPFEGRRTRKDVVGHGAGFISKQVQGHQELELFEGV